MKYMFLSRKAKAIVDIAIILCIIIALAYTDPHTAAEVHWRSSHCIVGVIGFVLILIHVIQHGRFIRTFTKKKVILKNKITALVIIGFILMTLSILFFIVGFNNPFLKFHNIIGHLFGIIVIIHTVKKFKRFTSLLTNK